MADTVSVLVSILNEWNTFDATGPGFVIRKSTKNHVFKPTPIVSCLWALSQCVGCMDELTLVDLFQQELLPCLVQVFLFILIFTNF